MSDIPGLHCLKTNHIWIQMTRATDGAVLGGWCLFCGVAVYGGGLFVDDRYVGPPLEFALKISNRPLLA